MIAIIYNPNSGGYRADTLRSIEAELSGRGLSFRLMPTERANHASELAARAVAEGAETLACYGGDGTAYEVLNGISDPSAVTLLLIPSGTGNDLLRTLGLPGDALKALRMQLDGRPRRMDLVEAGERRFLNVAGIGLDVQVLREYALLRGRSLGNFAYRLAIFRAMRHFRPLKLTLRMDDGEAQSIACSMLSIGNGKFIGGGMRCLPDADPFDGLLDVMLVRPVSNWLIALVLPLFFAGWHVRIRSLIQMRRVRSLEISAEAPFCVQMDGELSETNDLRIRIVPQAIQLRLP